MCLRVFVFAMPSDAEVLLTTPTPLVEHFRKRWALVTVLMIGALAFAGATTVWSGQLAQASPHEIAGLDALMDVLDGPDGEWKNEYINNCNDRLSEANKIASAWSSESSQVVLDPTKFCDAMFAEFKKRYRPWLGPAPLPTEKQFKYLMQRCAKIPKDYQPKDTVLSREEIIYLPGGPWFDHCSYWKKLYTDGMGASLEEWKKKR